MPKIAMKATTSPTLNGSGTFDTKFGDYEKVVSAIAMVNGGLGAVGDGKILQTSCSCSGITVTTTILKADLEEATDANRDWEVAATADLNTRIVTIVADCI